MLGVQILVVAMRLLEASEISEMESISIRVAHCALHGELPLLLIVVLEYRATS